METRMAHIGGHLNSHRLKHDRVEPSSQLAHWVQPLSVQPLWGAWVDSLWGALHSVFVRAEFILCRCPGSLQVLERLSSLLRWEYQEASDDTCLQKNTLNTYNATCGLLHHDVMYTQEAFSWKSKDGEKIVDDECILDHLALSSMYNIA